MKLRQNLHVNKGGKKMEQVCKFRAKYILAAPFYKFFFCFLENRRLPKILFWQNNDATILNQFISSEISREGPR